MVTIRQLAACAGGLTPHLSVRALFGGAAPPLSVLHLAAERMQKKIDVNIILVGWEAFVPAGLVEIEAAIDHVRELYGELVDMTIGNVSYFGISLDEADGYEHIDSEAEADALRAEWGRAGKGIDAFFVLSWVGATVGISPLFGRCREDDTKSALVVVIDESIATTSGSFAHELGHYLGLPHKVENTNLMFETVPNGEELTPDQVRQMRRHCIVYSGCRVAPA